MRPSLLYIDLKSLAVALCVGVTSNVIAAGEDDLKNSDASDFKLRGEVQRTRETWWNFEPVENIKIPVMTIESASAASAENLKNKKRPVLIWWGGSENTSPMMGRWLSQLARDEDIKIYSVGDRGVKVDEEGALTINNQETTNDINTQAHDLMKLAETLSKDPCVGRICVCGISQGGTVATRALAESPHIDSAVLISPGLDTMTKMNRYQRRQAVLAWAEYYGIKADGPLELTKKDFESKPMMSSKEGIAALPAEYKDSAIFYGPKLDDLAAWHFKNSNDPISISNINAFFSVSLDKLEDENYDLKIDPDHIIPANFSPEARALIMKNAETIRANNRIESPTKTIEGLKGTQKKVVIFHGEHDGLIPMAGFKKLNDLSQKDGYSYIKTELVEGRGHDVLNLSGLSFSNWQVGAIPYDPIRERALADIRSFVRGEAGR